MITTGSPAAGDAAASRLLCLHRRRDACGLTPDPCVEVLVTSLGSVDRGGFALDWVREGSGIPMLIVGPPRYYQRVFPADLRNDFEVVFGNTPGFVPTAKDFDVSTITRDTHAKDIEAIRQAAGLVRPIVVGHSILGTVVLEYARRYPDSVRGVAAIGAVPIGTNQAMQQAVDFFEQDADAERRAAHERNLATRRTPTSIATGQDFADLYIANGAWYWYDPAFDASPLWEGVHTEWAVLSHTYFTLYGDYDLEPLDVPVFVGHGRYDYVYPYYLWNEGLRQRLPGLHYKLYDKSGHTPPYEEPTPFAADLTAWARSL